MHLLTEQTKQFMDKQKLTEKYQKATRFEDVLSSLNKQLHNSQSELFLDDLKDQTTVHVIGAPRSGTTLLTQLALSNIEIGYINNFIATFWNAPLYGIYLSKKILGENYQSDLKSDFGRTNSIQEPHEFGYFWKHQLNYKEHLQQSYNTKHSIAWIKLKNILYQMCSAYNKPILFKSFLYGFHIREAVLQMPKTLFIYIERDLYQNAFSILKLRKKMFGDETIWASMKPHQYSFLKDENIYRQVVGQVLFLNYEYKKQMLQIPEPNKLLLSYSTLCLNTKEIIKQVHSKINNLDNVNYIPRVENIVKENISEIPNTILQEFIKAKEWLMSNFPELKE